MSAPDRSASTRALRLTLALTATFTVVEVVGGFVTGSLALLADAAHMLSDNLSLAIALFAAWLAARPAGPSRTFGYRRAEILAALFNGVTLVAISIWIFGALARENLPVPAWILTPSAIAESISWRIARAAAGVKPSMPRTLPLSARPQTTAL